MSDHRAAPAPQHPHARTKAGTIEARAAHEVTRAPPVPPTVTLRESDAPRVRDRTPPPSASSGGALLVALRTQSAPPVPTHVRAALGFKPSRRSRRIARGGQTGACFCGGGSPADGPRSRPSRGDPWSGWVAPPPAPRVRSLALPLPTPLRLRRKRPRPRQERGMAAASRRPSPSQRAEAGASPGSRVPRGCRPTFAPLATEYRHSFPSRARAAPRRGTTGTATAQRGRRRGR